jgi:hypothetical protein
VGSQPLPFSTGHPWLDLLILIAACLMAAGTITTVLGKGWRMAHRFMRLLDDFIGTPDNPGVLDRLRNMESHTQELVPNGGSSLADRITKMERVVTAIGRDVQTIKGAK